MMKVNIMDLSNLLAVESSELVIVNPKTEEPSDFKISFYGPTTDVVRKLRHEKTQIALNRLAKGKKAAAFKAEELEDDSIEDNFKRASGWVGAVLNGKELKFTLENWTMIMKGAPAVYNQVTEHLSDDSTFLG